MGESLSFFVPGFPETQAGMRQITTANGRTALVTTGSNGLDAWRRKVTNACNLSRLAQRHESLHGPVILRLQFWLPQPHSRPAADRHRGIGHSTVKPDIDKLVRAVQDSLTDAGAYHDDALVGALIVTKLEVTDHTLCGVTVRVNPWTANLAQHLEQRQQMPARLSQVDVAVRSTSRARRPHRRPR